MNKYDTIVIGNGPCGISCAIYLKRYGFNPIVVGKDMGALAKAHKIENYYGVMPITGEELVNLGIKQAQQLGIDVITDEVLSIEFSDGYSVHCKNNIFQAKTIMLALGASRNRIQKAEKFEGSGVSYCATCDGFFYRKKKTAIIGSGEYMAHELDVLRNIIPDLTVFTDGEELKVDVKDIPVITDKILSFNGDEHLESITTDKDTYEIYGCFIAKGSASGVTIAKHLGLGVDGNYIIVDENMMTNIPGIFAGGDIIGGLLQISKAVSDGAIAATSISKYLKK